MRLNLAVIAIVGLTITEVSAVSQNTIRSVWSGVYTASQAEHGQASYGKVCASCHGDQLEGENETPPLTGDEFMAIWDGHTVGELFDRVRTTMPSDHPGTLSPEDYAAILAYILESNKFPAGETDLPHQSEALKQISLDAKKPK